MPTMAAARVVLADDLPAFVAACTHLLEPEFEAVAMADNALSLTDAVESLQPELVVMDISFQSRGEINLARHLAGRFPDLRLIVLGDEEGETVTQEVLSWGAAGYVLRQTAVTSLVPAPRAALQRGRLSGDPTRRDDESLGRRR